MSLEIQLILFEPGDVELLPRGTALELASNIFLVIPYNPTRYVRNDRYMFRDLVNYFVIMPVVLTPSVLWVTKNLPASLIGL